jgi:endo-1,4-beta-xylanase
MKNPLQLQNKRITPLALLSWCFLLIGVQTTIGFAQIQTDVPALKDVYKNDFYIGCLLSYAHIGFPSDPYVQGQSSVVDANGGYLIKYHMNSMSPGNWMKAAYIVDISGSASAYNAAATQAEKDSIDMHPIITFNGNIIAQLNWAQRQGFTFRGHTLVWHSQTPGTAFFRSGYTSDGARLTKEKMTDRLENYIKEVIRLIHAGWPGLLSAYDVVNEAVNDGGGDRTTDSEWYVTFGDNTYIMKAFEFARKYTTDYGETQIKLYYNDYNTSIAAKADGIVRVCGPIFRAGLLDGIGMQEHDALSSPTAAQWIATYNKFDTICTEMAVTEFDVSTGSGTNYPSASILATQANQYGQLFKCFVERSYKSGRGKIINVSKDGLNDEWTFVKNQSSSLWDPADQCKPAFYAVANVGINYNALDSLIAHADTLTESDYTPASWSYFHSVLTSVENAKNRDYSSTVSADLALGGARTSLESAFSLLVKRDAQGPFFFVSIDTLAFGNVAVGSVKKDSINIFNFGTDTLKINTISATDLSFTFGPTALNIAPSANVYLVLTFNPTTASDRSGYIIFAHNAVGSSDSIVVDGSGYIPTQVSDDQRVPIAFALGQNYPNPFNPSTQITYSIPSGGRVSLKVYDLLGKEVATLFDGVRQPGQFRATFNGAGLASGVYFYKLQTPQFTAMKKMLLVK